MSRVIGLTGGIASGKGVVAQALAEMGMRVLDADAIAHEFLKEDKWVMKEVVRAFGHEVLAKDGGVDRKKLGEIVFRDPMHRRTLEDILHPRIREELIRRVLAIKGDVVLEIPLLIEQGGEGHVDLVVVVYCSRERQIERLMQRDGIDRDEASRRVDAQLPLGEKVLKADFLINTNGTLENTVEQTKRLYHAIREREMS